MAPFLRHVTARMEAAVEIAAATAASSADERRGHSREVEVFFAHDTTLLPTVALLDLLRVRFFGGRCLHNPHHSMSTNPTCYQPSKHHPRQIDAAASHGAGRSGAARAVPYASRLVLEAWAPPLGESSVGRIRLAYNGRVLATLEGGLDEWRARYAAALAVRCVGWWWGMGID